MSTDNITIPTFDQVLKWWVGKGAFHKLAEAGSRWEEHRCPNREWKQPPFAVHLPFGYTMRSCEGCGSCWRTDDLPQPAPKVIGFMCTMPEYDENGQVTNRGDNPA